MQMRKGQIKLGITALAVALATTMPLAGTAPAEGARASAGGHQKSTGQSKTQKKVSPKQRGIYWGAWIGDQLTGDQPPWDMSAVGHLSSLVGKGLSLLEFAAPFADCSASPCEFYKFPAYEMQTIRNYGAIPFFSWGSQSVPVPATSTSPPSSWPTSSPAPTTATSANSPKGPATGATPSSSASTGR